ncbi:hypothetical protein PAPYR_7689 [Paratrimastix pyriformis]|uniref:Uncharacterized protein n=1 Tax=Paratrimastix pyriformis TaxID=342808 RepID=A0ABQ8UFQ5_9EUKA|nr:hypothetical protein PAPYR_7689 [Paratrimastix pyriformis]
METSEHLIPEVTSGNSSDSSDPSQTESVASINHSDHPSGTTTSISTERCCDIINALVACHNRYPNLRAGANPSFLICKLASVGLGKLNKLLEGIRYRCHLLPRFG